MGGDYPSDDFEVMDAGSIRRVLHLPTGMTLETSRLRSSPIAVSSSYTVFQSQGVATRPSEVAQAALRHLRVWLMRRYGFV